MGRTNRKVYYSIMCLYVCASMIAFLGYNPAPVQSAKKVPQQSVHTTDTDINESSEPHECQYQNFTSDDRESSIFPGRYKMVNCSSGFSSLIFRSGDFLIVNATKRDSLIEKERFKGCKYATVDSQDSSFYVTFGMVSEPFFEDIELRPEDDHIVVECFDIDYFVISRSYHSFIRAKKNIEKMCTEKFKTHVIRHGPREPLSVLLMGISALSRQNFELAMPRSRDFLLNELNALEFYKHATVGDNELANSLAVLGGIQRFVHAQNWQDKGDIDKIENGFLSNAFGNSGFRTAHLFDEVTTPLMDFLKLFGLELEADYNYRHTLVASHRDQAVKDFKRREACVGDVAELTRHHDFWLQMATTFNNSRTTPYFGFSYAHLFSRSNVIYASDEYYYNFFKELSDRNLLNNTVLVFYSDHGMYFGQESHNAKKVIEARSPFLFLVFPPWFYRKYPHVTKVLNRNRWRLTTHFDLHETMLDLLYFEAKTETETDVREKRKISLFRNIPKGRTCPSAGVPAKTCICNGAYLSNTKISNKSAIMFGQAVIDRVNNYVQKYRSICVYQHLGYVESIRQIRFEFVESVNRKSLKNAETTVYEVRVRSTPGRGLYEGWVSYVKEGQGIPHEDSRHSGYVAGILGEVTRIDQPKYSTVCLQELYRMPFCQCREELKSS